MVAIVSNASSEAFTRWREGVTAWDRFHTPQDVTVLARSGRGKTRFFGLGTRPALLLIDLYEEVLGARDQSIDEAVADKPSSVGPAGWEAIDRTSVLLQQARDAKIPVIHVGMDTTMESWSRKPEKSSITDELPLAERYAFVAEVAPRAGEPVIRKAAPSAFQGTGLAFLLNRLGIDSLVVVGESTSGCVRATVVDGCTLRYQVCVVGDCCFDRTEASHWVSLFDLDQKYADVVNSSGAAEYFASYTP